MAGDIWAVLVACRLGERVTKRGKVPVVVSLIDQSKAHEERKVKPSELSSIKSMPVEGVEKVDRSPHGSEKNLSSRLP